MAAPNLLKVTALKRFMKGTLISSFRSEQNLLQAEQQQKYKFLGEYSIELLKSISKTFSKQLL